MTFLDSEQKSLIFPFRVSLCTSSKYRGGRKLSFTQLRSKSNQRQTRVLEKPMGRLMKGSRSCWEGAKYGNRDWAGRRRAWRIVGGGMSWGSGILGTAGLLEI